MPTSHNLASQTLPPEQPVTESALDPTLEIVTFGCRLNSFESEVIRAHIQATGQHDVVVIHTCGVTAEAERQGRQAIRKARRSRPSAQLIVTGCAAQMNPDRYATMAEVDVVLGNQEKLSLASYDFLRQSPLTPSPSTTPDVLAPEAHLSAPSESPPAARVHVADIMTAKNNFLDTHDTATHLITDFGDRARAFMQVQNGCDHRCTFCRIPYGRGPSRSVALGDMAAQTRLLLERGYQEIVLTGVDMTAYGRDLPGQPNLGQTVRRLLALFPNLPRLRLSSVDPVEIDDDLMALFASEPRLMPHLHLSVQAGDDLILKRMKRRHLRDDVIKLCARLRRERPEIVFGADLIAGFPTETDAMFENSLRLVEEAGLTYLHVFPFSPHPETPAARMPQVDRRVIKMRAAQLRQLGEEQLRRYLATQTLKPQRVLVEHQHGGHTETFAPVRWDKSLSFPAGHIVELCPQSVHEDALWVQHEHANEL